MCLYGRLDVTNSYSVARRKKIIRADNEARGIVLPSAPEHRNHNVPIDVQVVYSFCAHQDIRVNPRSPMAFMVAAFGDDNYFSSGLLYPGIGTQPRRIPREPCVISRRCETTLQAVRGYARLKLSSVSSSAPWRRRMLTRFCENAERGITTSQPASTALTLRSP